VSVSFTVSVLISNPSSIDRCVDALLLGSDVCSVLVGTT